MARYLHENMFKLSQFFIKPTTYLLVILHLFQGKGISSCFASPCQEPEAASFNLCSDSLGQLKNFIIHTQQEEKLTLSIIITGYNQDVYEMDLSL